ncbi:Os05g0406300 [Oryza sativa Japonica Group]|uniref:Os05g0406300 protein n=1 Tax=Oryza sativa subsp. japonica TaxID=39947 RepID=A0A0P0WME4_ORYSJ|nr:hypothetical protein EE612_029408 [Oryza sativa]BAS93960.1 Os05g0406300 [Oryza sativa Japonica Group]
MLKRPVFSGRFRLTSRKLLKNSLSSRLLLSTFTLAFVATQTRTASGPDSSLVYPSSHLPFLLSFARQKLSVIPV